MIVAKIVHVNTEYLIKIDNGQYGLSYNKLDNGWFQDPSGTVTAGVTNIYYISDVVKIKHYKNSCKIKKLGDVDSCVLNNLLMCVITMKLLFPCDENRDRGNYKQLFNILYKNTTLNKIKNKFNFIYDMTTFTEHDYIN
jgi:hypothetical protein